MFDSDEVIRKRLQYLEDRHWIDKQSKAVTFELLVLNNQHEPLVCEMKVTFTLTRGNRRTLFHGVKWGNQLLSFSVRE